MEGSKDFPQPSSREAGVLNVKTEQDYVGGVEMSPAQKATKLLLDLELQQKTLELAQYQILQTEVHQILLQMRESGQLVDLQKESPKSYQKIQEAINNIKPRVKSETERLTWPTLVGTMKDIRGPDKPRAYRRTEIPWAINPDNQEYREQLNKRLKELGVEPLRYPTSRVETPKAPPPAPQKRLHNAYNPSISTFQPPKRH